MKNIFVTLLVLITSWAAVPWSYFGLPSLDAKLWDYKLGLDLHGWVELDYLVDFSSTPDLTPERKIQIIEDMKTILDGRVRRIGTTEPTLNTAQYGEETHIVVQIPTPSSHDKLGEEERKQKDSEFIREAKSVIGQVIKIQFKEPRPTNEFDALMKKRGEVVTAIETSFRERTIPIDAWGQKMGDNYENVFSLKNAEVQSLLWKESLILSDLSALFPIETVTLGKKWFSGKISWVKLGGRNGAGFVSIESFDSAPLSLSSPIDFRMVFVDNEPLKFRPALGQNNQALDEKHLINTIPSPDQTTGQYLVNLVFDSEGQKMFGDITERNAGWVIAIFLGNELLTAPNVSGRIDGNAIITPGGEADSKKWATDLSKKINEGIVPVGIYEHSEQTIGPNLGKASLKQLIISGIIWLVLICIFLLWRYGSSGIVAWASLVIYIIVLLGIVRLMGVTLTLSGVAGIVLSIGIAIDSNILLLERVRDFLQQGKDMKTSLKLGFQEAWSAVWDSNLTGLFVGLILWWMGVSLVKWFGQMTVLGIVVSLLVVKHVCNPLTIWLRNKIG
jgi:protein-export membrane protein SecD